LEEGIAEPAAFHMSIMTDSIQKMEKDIAMLGIWNWNGQVQIGTAWLVGIQGLVQFCKNGFQ